MGSLDDDMPIMITGDLDTAQIYAVVVLQMVSDRW